MKFGIYITNFSGGWADHVGKSHGYAEDADFGSIFAVGARP